MKNETKVSTLDAGLFALRHQHGVIGYFERKQEEAVVERPAHIPQGISPELARELGLDPEKEPLCFDFRVSSKATQVNLRKEEAFLEGLSPSAKLVYYETVETLSKMNKGVAKNAKLTAYLMASHADARAAYLRERDGSSRTAYQIFMDGIRFVSDSYENIPVPAAAYWQQAADPSFRPNLVMYHNATPEKLQKIIDLGGMPLPSFAVTREDIPFNMGTITFLADPQKIRETAGLSVYSRDIYSLRVPPKDYAPLKAKAIREMTKQFFPYARDMKNQEAIFSYQLGNETSQEFARTFHDSPIVQRYYLENVVGIHEEYPRDGEAIDWYAVRRKHEKLFYSLAYTSWAENEYERFAGCPRLKVGRSYKPYTLDNVSEAMQREKTCGSEHTLFSAVTSGVVAARLSRKFSSKDAVYKASTGLLPQDQVDAAIDAIDEKGNAYRTSIVHYYYPAMPGAKDAIDAAMLAVAEAGKRKNITRKQMEDALARHEFKDVPTEIIDQAIDYTKALRDTPTQYFEAKPDEALHLVKRLFPAAIIPKDLPKNQRKFLEDKGIELIEYAPDNDADRQQKCQQMLEAHPSCLFQSENGWIKGAVEKRKHQVIHLFEEADASTCVHELAHSFLLDLERDAKDETWAGRKGGEAVKNLETICAWADYQPGQCREYEHTPWAEEFRDREKRMAYAKSMGDDILMQQLKEEWRQERFARGFEQYVRHGEAPSKPLKSIFTRLRRKMTQIYEAFKGDGGRATPEVEAVMAKMLVRREPQTAKAVSKAKEGITKLLSPIQKELRKIQSRAAAPVRS